MRLFRRRKPVYGPPAPPPPPCGATRYFSWQRCEKPEGHSGEHGRIIGQSITRGGLIDSTSTTWEIWS